MSHLNFLRKLLPIICFLSFAQHGIAQEVIITLVVDTEVINTSNVDAVSRIKGQSWELPKDRNSIDLVYLNGSIKWVGEPKDPATGDVIEIKRAQMLRGSENRDSRILKYRGFFSQSYKGKATVRRNAVDKHEQTYIIKFNVISADGTIKGPFEFDPKLKVKHTKKKKKKG